MSDTSQVAKITNGDVTGTQSPSTEASLSDQLTELAAFEEWFYSVEEHADWSALHPAYALASKTWRAARRTPSVPPHEPSREREGVYRTELTAAQTAGDYVVAGGEHEPQKGNT